MRWILSFLLLLSSTSTLHAQVPRIALEALVSGLSSPLYLTHAHDGSDRRFIVEQVGRIRVLQPGATVPTVFLDITSRLISGGERGLLGLAFHPAFASNGRFYVNYTRRPDGATVVAEYRASPPGANVAGSTETVLLIIPQPFENHNGGMIEFGPDGYLYIGMGDGGSGNDPGNRAQNLNNLLGKMLRIDVDRPQNGASIYAYGLRNPWRFSFDRLTGALWAGDVGQNAREEVDIVFAGGNYGWRVWEGARCTGLGPSPCSAPGFVPPIFDYVNTGGSGRCSITGGYVYRGTQGSLPYGAYIYGDYCSGEIMMFKDGLQTVLMDTGLPISSFGEDEAGEIYLVNHGGSVLRITNPDAIRTSTRDFSITDSTAFVASTAGSAPALTAGYARIQANAGSALPTGYAIVGFQRRGILASETTVPATPRITAGRIYAEVSGNVNTGIAIANLNAQSATVSFRFTGVDGITFRQDTTVIPANGRIAAFLNEAPFNGGSSLLGTFTFEASAPVSAVALRGLTNERGEFLMTTLPMVDPSVTTSNPIRLPDFSDGGGWTTQVILVNPSNDVLTGDVVFFDQNGQPMTSGAYSIQPQSSARVQTAGATSTIRSGSVQVAPRNSNAPVAFCILSFRTGGVTASESGVPAGEIGTQFRAYVESWGNIRPGIAIANPSNAAVNVTLEAGGISATINLPANGQRALFLNEISAFAALPAPFQGVLRMTSGAPIAATILRSRVNERGEFLITATPPVLDSGPAGSELVFPHFIDGAGYSMQFILFGRASSGGMDLSTELLFR